MVAEEYLSRSRLFRHLKSGPHGQLVELYAVRLVKDGLAHHGRCGDHALLAAAMALPPANGLRRWTYHYLFGLIAVIIRDISLCPAGSARRGTSIATGENIRRRPW